MTTPGRGIDVHSHIVPERFPTCLAAHVPAEWPSMAPAHACHAHVMIAGKLFRTVSDACWSPTRRLTELAEMGLARQAISPMPELLSYWFEPSAGLQMARHLNDTIAEMVSASNGALVGLGAVPLQDVHLAVGEVQRLMGEPGFAGVEIGSNVNGVPIGHADFAPFFEACEALGAAVFVHALKPAGMDRLVGPAPLQQVPAYPTDVGLAAASVLTTNLIVRRPKLRIGFSHGGGTLPSLLPRLEQSLQAFPALATQMTPSPSEQARRLFYDTLVFDPETLAQLVKRFGDTQLMLGTDRPFNFCEHDPVGKVDALGLEPTARDRLLHGNASRFLGLDGGRLS